MKKIVITILLALPIIIHAQQGTLFFENEVPAFSSTAGLFELGIQLRADSGGYITELRYYRWVTDLGAHFGKIWFAGNPNPQLLVLFDDETSNGWQSQSITPFYIAKGTEFAFSVNHNPFANRPGIIAKFPVNPSELLIPISHDGLTVVTAMMGQAPNKVPSIKIPNSFLRDVRWLRDPNQE